MLDLATDRQVFLEVVEELLEELYLEEEEQGEELEASFF